MNTNEAKHIVGGLTYTSKMPCPSISIPAQACQMGSKLVNIKGSVCEDCYAFKGMYRFKQGIEARDRRLANIYHEKWVEAMVHLLNSRKDKSYFRWHDSGDIHSMIHLCNIMEVAKRTPDTKHWLPTKEYAYVQAYVESGKEVPANMYVRLSAYMIDGLPPTKFANKLDSFDNVKGFIGTSTVVKENPSCPAREQGNECGSCRTCWSRESNVSYHLH